MKKYKLEKETFDDVKQEIESENLIPFFVTNHFNIPCYSRNLSYRGLNSLIDQMWCIDEHTHYHLIPKIKNWSRKHKLLPRAYCFLDFPGTKHHDYYGYKRHDTPHSHSIYLIHPKTIEYWRWSKEELKTIADQKQLPRVNSIHIKKIGPTDADLRRTISYCSKFVTSRAANTDELRNESLFQMYPRCRSDFARYKNLETSIYDNPAPSLDVAHLHSLNTSNNHIGGINLD